MRQSATEIRPEVQLLLCCALGVGSQPARTNQILQGPVDWPLVFHLANENGMLPLFYKRLPIAVAAMSPEAKALFSDANRKNMFSGLLLGAELLRITEVLRQKQVPALCYKGPTLGQLAYEDPLLRQFGDLDMVVPQRSMAAVYDAMHALGYTPKFPYDQFVGSNGKDIPGEYVFVHKVNGAMVEWHTEQTLRHFPRRPDLDTLIGRSVTVSVNGRQVATFARADSVLMLCVHGAKDFWSRLIWIADVASLAGKLTDADWAMLLTEAKKYDAERMVMLGLWLAQSVFERQLPASISQAVNQDHVAAGIGRELCGRLLYGRELPAGVTWRSLYRIKMVSPIWKGIRYWLRLSTTPAEEDWSMSRPAAGVRASYAFSRPMRLLRKYGRSAPEEFGDKRD